MMGFIIPIPPINPIASDLGSRQRPKITKIKLADGKERTIQHMTATSFWHPDGTPMSAQQFIESLYGSFPDFFRDEAELRALWSSPDTRAKMLEGLAEKGFGGEQMAEMQRIIDAEKSDLFDVLAQYVKEGVGELNSEKLSSLLKLKYNNAIADAIADLGKPEAIGSIFSGCQQSPRSEKLSDDENAERQNELKARLQRERLIIFAGKRVGDDNKWPPEPSFLVLEIPRMAAIALGRDFGQNAIIVGNRDAVPYLVECE